MYSRLSILFCFFSVLTRAQDNVADKSAAEIRKTEHAFMEMAKTKNIAEAFAYFADTAAVIRRGNPETLIMGKQAIQDYYVKSVLNKADVEWQPDFVEVAASGDLAYSYGKYVWKLTGADNKTTEFKGIYITIWKKQSDGSWRYIWD